jgi:uncharacterized protein DUF2877
VPGCRRAAEAGHGLRIVALGQRARRALERSRGVAHPLPGFPGSPWYEAGGEIVWVGARLPALHPRAVLTSVAPARGQALCFESIPRNAWSARCPGPDANTVLRVVARAKRLRRAVVLARATEGFGSLLARTAPQFPLDRAMPLLRALSAAIARDDPCAAFAPACSLLGLGAGLTPSGDDLVGGVLFGTRFVRPADRRWTLLGRRLSREIGSRSHAVSAALFTDLAAGRSFAPLHEVADALIAGDEAAAVCAAQALVAIGHSSGWDMLTGFLIGVGAFPAARS